MATKTISYRNTQMTIKFPKFVSPQIRLPSSSSFSSPSSSVLPGNPNFKRTRPPTESLSAEQRDAKKRKTMPAVKVNSSSSTATPPLSPEELHVAMIKIKFADAIFKAEKQVLEKVVTDPAKLKKALEEFKRDQLELKQRVEAQLKQMQEDERASELARREQQRRMERLARDKMEAEVKLKLGKPYCCTLKELGLIIRCDCAWLWGCSPLPSWSPLEPEEEEDELEEGEISC